MIVLINLIYSNTLLVYSHLYVCPVYCHLLNVYFNNSSSIRLLKSFSRIYQSNHIMFQLEYLKIIDFI